MVKFFCPDLFKMASCLALHKAYSSVFRYFLSSTVSKINGESSVIMESSAYTLELLRKKY